MLQLIKLGFIKFFVVNFVPNMVTDINVLNTGLCVCWMVKLMVKRSNRLALDFPVITMYAQIYMEFKFVESYEF